MITVYSYLVLDVIHKGHLLFMQSAKSFAGSDGRLIVGILTDDAVMEKKSKPIMSFEERMEIASAIKYVDVVVPQATYSPLPNVIKMKPNILIESSSHTIESINEAETVMESINGKVIVIPYFPLQSSTKIKEHIRKGAK